MRYNGKPDYALVTNLMCVTYALSIKLTLRLIVRNLHRHSTFV